MKSHTSPILPAPAILSVGELNRQIRFYLENEIGEIVVMGELSNLSKPRSGHLYFTLKDSSAQLRCVYFRNYHVANTQKLVDGAQVILKGQLSLYEARGDYQLIVYSLNRSGLGELYQQFEALKLKLQGMGLFSQERKKAIPRFPNVIGIITSSSGAALQDILTTLARRYPLAKIQVYPSEVQGKEAAPQLIKAINFANKSKTSNVLILARGGGSIEDLWAFNHEELAMVISQSQIPIVTGVGHETDFTIADFVSDLRAATPTAAAETITPNQVDLVASLQLLQRRLVTSIHHHLQHRKFILTNYLKKFSMVQPNTMKYWQTLDLLDRELHRNIHNLIQIKKNKIELSLLKLQALNPRLQLQQTRSNLKAMEKKLIELITDRLDQLNQNLRAKLGLIHAVSPLATLDRGYSITTENNRIITHSNQISLNDQIQIQLAKGSLECTVFKIHE